MNIYQEIKSLYKHKGYRNTGVLEQVPTDANTKLDVGCGAAIINEF